MYLVTQALILLLATYFSNAGYGIPAASSGSQYGQSDVQAPAYVPPYLKNQRYGNRYSGTKTAYSGTKTAPSGTKTAYSGTKTAYRSGGGAPGTKNAYSGTKSKYSESKTWYSNTGNAPNYYEFQNSANQRFMPQCEPACKNTGICVDTNTCQCPSNYHGKFCEFEKKPCLSYPPLPMNSRRTCSSETCTITCMEGHKFIDGSTVANMRCMEGQWQPTRADFSTIPDCEPECNPPCTNGGVCLAVNTCECPADFRGPQCQYSVSACDIRKLAFNGGYNCAGDSESSSCALSCPPGASYSSPPAPLYTCRYDTGVFQPQPIPNCVFPEIVVITPGNHIYNSTYTYTEYTSESHGRRKVSSESQNAMTESTHGTHSVTSIEDLHTHGHGRRLDHGTGGPITVVVQDLTPKGGTCLTWAGVHYKTFDGKIYSFQSPCQHILVRDSNDHKYSVEVKHGECKNKALCPSELTIYLEDKFYVLSVGEDGSVLFRNTKRLIPIPAALPGVRVSMPSDHVVIQLDAVGVTMKWDTNDVILVEGSVLLWNTTEGLCGTLDGNPENDFMTRDRTIAKTKSALASSWQVNKIGDLCDSVPTETSACSSEADEDVKKAQQFCANIFSKDKFRKCSEVMDVSLLLEACQWDYCACSTTLSAEDCACSTVAVYAKECLRHGITEMKDWRDADTCPMKCPEGKIYKSCGSDSQASCAFPMVAAKSDNTSCVEGCYCPEGLLLEAGRCVPKADCPCRLRNKSFKPGASIRKDCNTCTCESGEWTCTKIACGARCGAVGDPHYTTFDGLRYDFMGHCTYTMLQAENTTIEVENVACSGAITEAMDLSPYKGAGKPSCTKAVTLYYGGANVHMKQGGFILVNGKEVSTLPVMVGDVRIRAASSMFVIIQLPNKVDLWWDGNTRVFIDVPANFQGKTKGLCGTFNLNQKDDFLTPENDVEQSALAFANKWKTREFCTDVDTAEPEHPCKANIENKEAAEKYCSKLKSKVFEECHWYVDVEPYYEACVYDMCACGGDAARCLCPVLGHYAMDCAARGVRLQWRYHVHECELQCTGGQEYTVCADSCLRKCADMALAASGTCKPCCVEGCACPPGQLLDDNNLCVPTGLCPCYHKGMQFNAGYKEVRAGRRERELCTCVGARWDCKPATPMEIQNYPPAEDLRSNCSASNNMEFTTCEIAEPLTCKNMHLAPSSTTAECRPGCQCKKGFVLDTTSKKCVLPTQCPCHHGGRSYPDGHVMQEECNKCECKSGNWECSQRKCAGLCAAWGDSHVVTFDGTDYDFEGVCTYLLAKGVMDTKDGFDVEIQNVPCGTTGATCSKSVTLKIGGGGNEEIVSLTKDAPIPDISKLKRIKMRMAGVYVFLDVPTLGMSLQWDRGMRVYVKIESIWQGRVKGLCGNYNGDMRDDFQTPSSGGMAESSALIFADSWKLKATCPKPEPLFDHCNQRPERKEWASSICSTMKQYPFTLCHAEVSPSPYIARCTRDACACDSGDDCECACTALAAYAHACAHRGVTFKWRTQEICPMQCDEECTNYEACISPCPVETCDNTLDYPDVKTTCEQDTCVEGCKPKKSCPKGQVYKNSTHSECVPRAKCKKVCMTLEDGTEVGEGEVMEEDDCHTCRCSKKQKICTGEPCTTATSAETTPKPHDEPLKCVTGWSNWINRGPPEIGPNGESIDNEPLPRPNELVIGTPMCKERFMKKIECRTVEGHQSAKETGLDAECSLERGLYCKEKGRDCLDFEIRVYCECDNPEACENSIHPSEKHPTDCSKFYECAPSGPVLKDCGPGTWYNPSTMVCDWPASVLAVRPDCADTTTAAAATTSPKPKRPTKRPPVVLTISTGATEEPSTEEPETTGSVCPPGRTFSACAYRCDRLCDYYKQKLIARGRCIGETCVEGCVKKPCASNKFWRDDKTCVHKKDCTCYSNKKIVKPGGVVIDGCIKCQCLDNNFHCDSSDCVVVVTPRPGSTHQPIIFTLPGTTGPPPVCDPEDYKDVLADLPDSAFTASSVTSKLFEPQYAKLKENLDITAGSWSPKEQDTNQYIQVELEKPEPIFGVTMQGSPLFDQYVTTYQVLYGNDEYNLKPVTDSDGEPKIFPGPTNHNESKTEMIVPPIETKILRIRPLTWQKEIAIRFELIGCGKPQSTVPVETTTAVPTTETSTSTAATTPTTKETTPTTKETSPPTTETTPTVPIPESTEYKYMTGAASTTPVAAPLIIPNLMTPPPECNPEGYYNLMWGDQPLPDSAFSASSVASGLFEPQYAKLNGHPLDVTAGSWNPAVQDTNQYIQVRFPHPEPIYGVWMQGSPLFDQYVTSYYVLYGHDGISFSSVDEPDGTIKVFRGPVNHNTPMKQMIDPPIDATVVRIQPLTWHEDIAIRFELIGCREPESLDTTKTTMSLTTQPPQCDEPLGLGADLPLQSIEVSSNSDARQFFLLEGERGWRPLYSTPGEWIMFNFTSPRNITGIKTKGGPKGWVTTYKIMYTSDLSTFNPVIEEDGNEKQFAGNFDKDTVVVNEFRPPIHAQYLKVLPLAWRDGIEMRIEPIGCFEPYPVTEKPELTTTPTTPSATETCVVCPGVLQDSDEACSCAAPAKYYDGENCVTRDQCPCVEGIMTYPVGSTFRGANCDECVCKLGGITDCKPAEECNCAPDLVPKISTSTCECRCAPCPEGTKICPTSKICLPLEKWCDGLQDCPDDERDCTTTSTTTPTTPATTPATTEAPFIITKAPTVSMEVPTTVKPLECPKVECPPNYSVQYTSSSRHTYSAAELPPPRARYSYQRYHRGHAKGGYTKTSFSKTTSSRGGYSKGGYGLPPPPRPNQAFSLDKPELSTVAPPTKEECSQFKCIPKLPPYRPGHAARPPVCAVTICPQGYTLKLDASAPGHNKCPQYDCVPPPERPAFCNVTGRTFNTFDGVEYKFDACFHILARENRFDAWTILLRKKCRLDGCQNELLILQDDQLILVKPTMMIEYDNYEYTVEQTSKICFQKNSFDVNRLGNGVAISSRKYNFTVLYNSEGDIKIGVSKSYMGAVDGLCGAFDGVSQNDRRMPDGRLTASIAKFGRSWAKPGLPPDACQIKLISDAKQKKAWDLCEVIMKAPLSECGSVLNLHKWRNICLEKICECSGMEVNGTHRTEEQCRCLLVEQMVAECLAADKNIDLSNWRIMNDCPADCPAPLVHYDCYRKSCEPSCALPGARRACAAEAGQCFPGCYCPEGKLRRGDQCVLPTDCLDCSCNGVGTPAKYVTFEGDDLPYLGNCTYLASRDRNATGAHKYELYSTNGPCDDNADVVCTRAVHLLYEKNVIHVTRDSEKKLLATIGNNAVFKYPMKNDWVTINQVNGQDLTIFLPDVHVELTVLQSKLEFTVRVPSYQYANKTEGLCGVCAGYQEELVMSNGTVTDDIDEYGKSWQASPEALTALDITEQGECLETPPPPECVPPPPESNPCYNLYNADRFGACHALVEPESFVKACEADVCANATDACVALERYAAACSRQGVCLENWRDDLCPFPCDEPLVYRACVNCELTCENSDELTKNPDKCAKQPGEGCFCPEGKVRVNNTCIEPTKCFPCDANKEHYAGDEWKEDACTTCSCAKSPGANSAHVTCTQQACSAPVCYELEDLVTTPPKPGECCATYSCVQKPKQNCTEPKKMTCGFGQVLKQKTTADGCQEFACECKPASECEPLPNENEVEIMEPGMERVVDNSGCCPRVQFLCRKEACPQPPACPKFHDARTNNVTGKCCPEHTCELPKDKCIATLEWEAASKGGEKPRTTPQTILKDVESVWLDGPCRSCRCERGTAGGTVRCAASECAPVHSTELFVLEPRPVPFQCCPQPVHVACRDRDNIYKVGENWTSTTNPCESYKCVQTETDGKLEKITTVQQCNTDCQPGWKYFPATKDSGVCCGACEPVACIVDGKERAIGERWTSSDFCANYTCANLNGTLQVECANETCPEVSENVKRMFVLSEEKVPGKCCPKEEPVACRVGSKIYQEGQTWASPDPCKNVTCARDTEGRLTQQESVATCTEDCRRGWVYEKPAPGVCCGHCRQKDCVVDDKLIPPGTTWASDDNCTTYSCDQTGEEVFVTSSKQLCPDVSACAPENLVNDTCCQVCVEQPEALSKCVPTSVPSGETVGLVRMHLGGHGLCVNKQPLVNFKECRGSCDSGTLFNNQTGIHDTRCECCQATKYTPVEVSLSCEDGSAQAHRLASPAACACAACNAADKPMWPGKPGYIGVKQPPKKPAYAESEEDEIPEIYQRFGSSPRPRPRL